MAKENLILLEISHEVLEEFQTVFPGEAALKLLDREVQRTVEKLQWILNVRRAYAVSGAMRWANSSEAWFSHEESIEVGRLHTS